MSKKELILTHPTSLIDELFPVEGFVTGVDLEGNFSDIESLEKRLDEGLSVNRRLVAETDVNTRHLLPYVNVFRVKDGTLEVFVYRRVKGIGEERLLGKHSIGVGGHINISHAQFHDGHSQLNLGMTIMHNVMEELIEELSINDEPIINYLLSQNIRVQPSIYGYINDNSDEVGKRHLGVSMLMIIPEEFDPVCAEASAETIGFVSVEKLKAELCDGDSEFEFENWSSLILANLSHEFIDDLTAAASAAAEHLSLQQDAQALALAEAEISEESVVVE